MTPPGPDGQFLQRRVTHDFADLLRAVGAVDRVTEQGEMIQALFGLPGIATRTMEVFTSGTLDAWLTPGAAAALRTGARAWIALSADGARAYRSYVHENPSFIEYFRTATPLPELEHVNIGSRPARRKPTAGIETLRAIPWQFCVDADAAHSGRVARNRGSVGAGDAVAASSTSCGGCIASWPHFRSVMDLTAMVLAKTDARIAAEYERRPRARISCVRSAPTCAAGSSAPFERRST